MWLIMDASQVSQLMSQKCLWMSNLGQLTSAEIINEFGNLQPETKITSVKVKRNYCFVEFQDNDHAKKALELDGVDFLGQKLSLNWATYSTEYSVFIGDLSKDVDESGLTKLFAVYDSLKGVKIILDQQGKSKGYGFARFKDHDDQLKALSEMHGRVVYDLITSHGKALKLSTAAPRKKIMDTNFQNNNTTVFVGGLYNSVTEHDLLM